MGDGCAGPYLGAACTLWGGAGGIESVGAGSAVGGGEAWACGWLVSE